MTTEQTSPPYLQSTRWFQRFPVDSWISLAIIGLIYLLVEFVVTPNRLSPLHQDDYLVLGYGIGDLNWYLSRPISSNIAYLMGAAGPDVAYFVMSALTVAIICLVAVFVSKLFAIRWPWYIVLLYAVLVAVEPSTFEHGKYLGLITNLCSHVFGIASLLALWAAWRQPAAGRWLLGFGLFALSALSKEDFLLPPFLLMGYLMWKAWRDGGGWRAPLAQGSVAILALAAVAASSLYFNIWVSSPFLMGVNTAAPDSNYTVSLALPALLQAAKVLTLDYVPVPALLAVGAVIVVLLARPDKRAELLLLIAIIVTLILPYAIIPKAMPVYRAFAWLPWLAAVVATAVALFAIALGRRNLMAVIVPLAVATGLCTLTLAYNHRQRLLLAEWYQTVQSVNYEMLSSLVRHRQVIARESVVGIVGVEGLSPWSNTNGLFVRDKLQLPNRWIVFVNKSSPVLPIDNAPPGEYRQISVQTMDRLCTQSEILVMAFNETGRGAPVKSTTLCHSRQPSAAPAN